MERLTTAPTIYVNARAIIQRQANNGIDIILQTRNKSHETTKTIELPGGQVEPFESLLDALKREVKEETGLTVTVVEGASARVETNSNGQQVECLRPYAVYQTLAGPVDSMGVYFLCNAEGEPLLVGDDTGNVGWVSITQVADMVRDNQQQFSWVDLAALKFYLIEQGVLYG